MNTFWKKREEAILRLNKLMDTIITKKEISFVGSLITLDEKTKYIYKSQSTLFLIIMEYVIVHPAKYIIFNMVHKITKMCLYFTHFIKQKIP